MCGILAEPPSCRAVSNREAGALGACICRKRAALAWHESSYIVEFSANTHILINEEIPRSPPPLHPSAFSVTPESVTPPIAYALDDVVASPALLYGPAAVRRGRNLKSVNIRH
jgi:hypothetical protein